MPSKRTFIYGDEACGHVIGEIVQKEYKGERISALYVYEKSVDAEQHIFSEELPTKRFIAIGDADGIECTICRRERDWKISNRTSIALMVSLLNSLYEPGRKEVNK